ncbi:hypothetical protein K1719_042232 [Acacia pycnantha]|nr:hypothetical protein K1719_042232 [Acacia pycnantha]
MYPVAYKRREIQTLEVEKKDECYSPQFDVDNLVSDLKCDQLKSNGRPAQAFSSKSSEQVNGRKHGGMQMAGTSELITLEGTPLALGTKFQDCMRYVSSFEFPLKDQISSLRKKVEALTNQYPILGV